ncbi:hypothetical protein GC170_04990 [bacterium]|nr:hypothetical protein [bacterium]
MTIQNLEFEKVVTDESFSSFRPNALQHGLTARRYVSEELARRVHEIRQELIEIHQPESTGESQLVDRLAIAQARLEETQAAWDERLRWQRIHVEELYDRGESQRFANDLKAWRASPQLMQGVFGQTRLSATFLKDLWKCIVDAIESGVSITCEQIREMIMALGSDWRVDRVDVDRGRIMSAFIALSAEPRAAIEKWVHDSRAGREDLASFDDDLDRAHDFLIGTQTEEHARSFLKTLAEEQLERAAGLVEKAQAIHVRERARCAEVMPGHPMGDASDVRETRLIRRYLTSAENRAEKIERRLLALIKGRALRDMRSAKPLPQSRGESLPHTHETHARNACESSSKTAPDPLQDDVNKDDASLLRNGSTAVADPVPSVRVDRLRTRPDPKKLAKSWREKAGLTRRRKNHASYDTNARK